MAHPTLILEPDTFYELELNYLAALFEAYGIRPQYDPWAIGAEQKMKESLDRLETYVNAQRLENI